MSNSLMSALSSARSFLTPAAGKIAGKAARALPVVGAGFTAYNAYDNYQQAKGSGDDSARAATRGIFRAAGTLGGGALGLIGGGGIASAATGLLGGMAGGEAGDRIGGAAYDKIMGMMGTESPVPAPYTAAEQAAMRAARPTAANSPSSKYRFGASNPELAMFEMNVDAGKYVTDARSRQVQGEQLNNRYAGGLQLAALRNTNATQLAGLQNTNSTQLAGLRNSNLTQQNISFRGFDTQDRSTEASRQIGLSNINAQKAIGLDQGLTSRFNTATIAGAQIRTNLDNNITSRQANTLQAGVMNNQTFAGERTAQRNFEMQKYISGSGDRKTDAQLKLGLDANYSQRYMSGSGDRKTDAQVEIARIQGGATQAQQQFQQQSNNAANYQMYLAEERGAQRQKKQLEDATGLEYLKTLGNLYR